MSMVVGDNFAAVLERTIRPQQGELPPEAARYFLRLEMGGEDRARMNELAAKARSGTLEQEEETELAFFMQLGWLLDLIKSKARLSLGVPAGNP